MKKYLTIRKRRLASYKIINKIFLAMTSLFILSTAQAGTPLWTITPAPGNQTTLTVPENSTAVIQYIVQNQSNKPKTLKIQPITGIQQTTPCQLNPKGQAGSTCNLNLSITGSALPASGIQGGPRLCLAENDIPNPNQCYQPSAANILRITRGGTEQAGIQVAPASLDLIANSGVPGFLTITNNSTSITAQNVQATLPASWVDVTQDASNCTSIVPNGGTCQLQFTPGATVYSAENIPISGNNTTQVTALISVSAPPPQASLSITGAPLILSPNCNTASVLTVTNTSLTTVATNISINLGSLAGDVQLSADTCTGNNLAANGGQCTFGLEGINTAAASNISVTGTNTPAVDASVEVRQLVVNDIYQQGIIFEVDSCNAGKVSTQQNNQNGAASILIQWGGWNGGPPNCILTNATDLSNGATNTQTIFNVLTTNNSVPADTYAAGVCYEYSINSASTSPCTGNPGEVCYSDWYLPATNELNTLWEQTSFNGGPIIGFDPNTYWSSTEINACTANLQSFLLGTIMSNDKLIAARVRCVRVFSALTP